MTDSAILKFNRNLLFEFETDGTPEGSIVAAPFTGTIPGGGPVLTFESKVETVIPLIVDINPVQEGNGDPSPSNIRPISGWDNINIYVSPTTSAEEGSTTTINLPQTVYGGVLDVVSGKLVIDREAPTLNDMTIERTNAGYFIAYPLHSLKRYGTNAGQTSAISSCFFRRAGSAVIDNLQDNIFSVASANINETIIAIRADNYSSVADLKSALGTNRICYELATPTEIQLTPTEVKTLIGVNNIWANSGNVYTLITSKKITYKIAGGAEDVQRFNKIWESLLLYRNGRFANGHKNLFSEGDTIIPHDPTVLKEG